MELRSKRCAMQLKKSINNVLPNELIEKILTEIPTKDLLNCRLVSALWKIFASSICCRRHVTVNLQCVFYNTAKYDQFYDTFHRLPNVPWSACSIELWKTRPGRWQWQPDNINSAELKKFTKTFGTQLRKVTLKGDDVLRATSTLKATPNLEFLICRMKPNAKDIKTIQSSISRLNLNKLKQLWINVHSKEGVKLLQFIARISTLRSILVQVNLNPVDIPQIPQMTSLLASIPTVALDISNFLTTETFQLLTVKELKLKKLEFKLPTRESPHNENYYRAFEFFLLNNAESLEKLIIHDNELENREEIPRDNSILRVPLLPKLKNLKYIFPPVTHTATYIHPFTTNQFPVLQKVTIQMSTDEHATCVPKIIVFEGIQFESVKKLVLNFEELEDSTPMTTDFSSIFPNLISLTCRNVEIPLHIYEKMIHLEHISLTVGYKVVKISGNKTSSPGDRFVIVCDYPKTLQSKKQEASTVETLWLSTLVDLKTFSLDFGNCDFKEDILDPRSHLQLLQMHTLDRLTFYNIKIPKSVKDKLDAFHRLVEVF